MNIESVARSFMWREIWKNARERIAMIKRISQASNVYGSGVCCLFIFRRWKLYCLSIMRRDYGSKLKKTVEGKLSLQTRFSFMRIKSLKRQLLKEVRAVCALWCYQLPFCIIGDFSLDSTYEYGNEFSFISFLLLLFFSFLTSTNDKKKWKFRKVIYLMKKKTMCNDKERCFSF